MKRLKFSKLLGMRFILGYWPRKWVGASEASFRVSTKGHEINGEGKEKKSVGLALDRVACGSYRQT